MNSSPNNPAKVKLAGLSQDFYLGLVIVIIGFLLLWWLIPTQVDDSGSFGLPPSLAPRLLAWLMIICGGVLALQNLRQSTAGPGLKLKEVAFVAACLFSAGSMLVLMSIVGRYIDQPNSGFLLTAPIGLFVFTHLHSQAPIWAYAFNVIVAPFVIFAAFWWGLELPLP